MMRPDYKTAPRICNSQFWQSWPNDETQPRFCKPNNSGTTGANNRTCERLPT